MPIHLFWKILSEYISAKDQESAAHHLVNELIDAGAEEDDLWEMCKGNPGLRRVVNEFLDDEEEELEDDE